MHVVLLEDAAVGADALRWLAGSTTHALGAAVARELCNGADHADEEVGRVKGVGSCAEGAHAMCVGRGFLGFVVLAGTEGVVEADGEEDLFEGDEHGGDADREVLACDLGRALEEIFAREDGECDLIKKEKVSSEIREVLMLRFRVAELWMQSGKGDIRFG